MRRRHIIRAALVAGLLILLTITYWPAEPGPPVVQPVTAEAVPTDLTDALLLYDSHNRHVAEWGFMKVTAFYGLKRAAHDLRKAGLTDALLRDEQGDYLPIVFLDGKTLAAVVKPDDLAVLKKAIHTGGANLFVSSLEARNIPTLRELTGGEIIGSTKRQDRQRDYLIASDAPEITRELSGITITAALEQRDYGLIIRPDAAQTQILVWSTDDDGAQYPIVARYQDGAGSVFVASNYTDPTLKFNRLEWFYTARRTGDSYEQPQFSQLVPLMMFVRYAAGNEAWHRNQNYANFMIDDPALNEADFDYYGLLRQAIAHNFHVTLAMPPAHYDKSDQSMVSLFLSYPNRLSLVQHGNNHDGYEFYKYATDSSDEYPARPIAAQEAAIVEGRTRLEAHARRTGIDYAPVMIFPYNISPPQTLSLLKQYNYQATINSMDVPLNVERANEWDSYMYPAELTYNAFAVKGRAKPAQAPYPFLLFIDHPILIYEHPDFFHDSGMDALNPSVAVINNLQGKVEWQSLDYIMQRLYLEKTNDDGSIDVMFFGNQVLVSNETNTERVYHLRRKEDLRVPIHRISIDDEQVPYTVRSGVLTVDVTLRPFSSRELRIVYGAPNKDFSIAAADVSADASTGTISAVVYNRGTAAGPVSVEFYAGDPAAGGAALGIVTAQRIEPGGSAVVTLASSKLTTGQICAVADPYAVILESDKQNNRACIAY